MSSLPYVLQSCMKWGEVFNKSSFHLGAKLNVLKKFSWELKQKYSVPQNTRIWISMVNIYYKLQITVFMTSRTSLLNLLDYRRLPGSEGLQNLQTFATINSEMFPKQASM